MTRRACGRAVRDIADGDKADLDAIGLDTIGLDAIGLAATAGAIETTSPPRARAMAE